MLYEVITENLICRIGINRKSRQYDKDYYPLYQALYSACFYNNDKDIFEAFKATKKIKIGLYWRKHLFGTASAVAIEKHPRKNLINSYLITASNKADFNIRFFQLLHLFKAKATLNDYLDLNRRYFKITDTVIFGDGKVHFDVVPKQFMNSIAEKLFEYAFILSDKLFDNCSSYNFV